MRDVKEQQKIGTKNVQKFVHKLNKQQTELWDPVWVPGLGIETLHFLAGCRKRQLNQAPLNLRGLI